MCFKTACVYVAVLLVRSSSITEGRFSKDVDHIHTGI